MKKILVLAAVALIYPYMALGADEKIDPQSYICAELVASSVDGQPPLFEGLQLDGYASGLAKNPVAEASVMEPLLLMVYDSCSAEPTDKALGHWQDARKKIVAPDESPWRADKTTCADYTANPDDGSGFVIWLDGYQRAKTGKAASVFSSQDALDNFLAICQKNPDKLMLDVMVENAK